MAINYRQPQQLDSLSPAYQMLVQAELAKADAMGRVFEPLTKSILANRELAVRREEAASESAWKQRYGDLQQRGMDINEQELGLKKQELDAETKDNAAFGEALQMLRGGKPSGYSASTDGSTGGGGGLMGSAGGALPSGVDRHGPEIMQKLAGMRPERAMRMMSFLDAMDQHESMQQEREAKRADIEAKQKADAERRSQYMQTIDRGVKEKWIPETKAAIYRTRANNPQDLDALGKELSEGADKYITDTEDKRSYTEQYKTLRKTIESDKEIDPARKSDLLKQLHAIDIGNMSAKDKSKELTQAYDKAYDPNRTKEKEDKGPFKFLEDDPEIKKGGVIERAPETTKANVKIQAMTMAAQNRMLSPEAMTFMTGAEDYSKIANFYDKLSAVEADTVKRFEDMIWTRYGWTHEPEIKLPGDIGPEYTPGAAPSSPAQQTPLPLLPDLTPEQRAEMLKVTKSGDEKAIDAFWGRIYDGMFSPGKSKAAEKREMPSGASKSMRDETREIRGFKR